MGFLVNPYWFASAAPNPEAGLTLTSSWAAGSYTDDIFFGTEAGVLAMDGTIPATPSGAWHVSGNQFRGTYIGFRANQNFVIRGGSSADSAPSASGTNHLVLLLATGQPSGTGTLVVEFNRPGAVGGAPTLRAWWNGVSLGTTQTSGGGALTASEWTRITPTWFYNVANTGLCGVGEVNTVIPISSPSNLRYYRNQLVAL